MRLNAARFWRSSALRQPGLGAQAPIAACLAGEEDSGPGGPYGPGGQRRNRSSDHSLDRLRAPRDFRFELRMTREYS
jgi:hypothetical protein